MKSRTDLNLLEKYNITREDKEQGRLLETHKYLSKRCFMKEYGGYMIPDKSIGKRFRTSY